MASTARVHDPWRYARISPETKLLQNIHDHDAEHWLLAAKEFFVSDDLIVYDSPEFRLEWRRHTANCFLKLSPISKSVTAKLSEGKKLQKF